MIVFFILGVKGDFSEKFHVTPDGKHLYFATFDNVSLCDLTTGQRQNVAFHSAPVKDVVTMDAKTLVTVADDMIVRIWDLARGTGQNVSKSQKSTNKIEYG